MPRVSHPLLVGPPKILAEGKTRLNLLRPVFIKIRELDAAIAKELEKLEGQLIDEV